MNSSRQTGSIASFVVVGLVLAGLLVAGLYFSKERGRQVASGDNTTNTATQAPEETTSDENKDDAATKPDESTDTETSAPASPTPADESETPSPSSQSTEQGTDSQTPATAPATGPSHIATTGPEDSFIAQATALLAVSLAVVSYATSRRTFVRSARS